MNFDMWNQIITRIVNETHWTFFFESLIVIFLVWLTLNVTEISPLTVLRGIRKELVALQNLSPTAGAVNIVTIVLLALLAIIYFFVDGFRKMLTLEGAVGGKSSGTGEAGVFLACLLIISITAILCIAFIRPKGLR
jgi:hypothetical protein